MSISHGNWIIPPLLGEEPNFNIGRKILFECDENYKLIGASTIHCLSSAYWSDYPPQCQPKGKLARHQINFLLSLPDQNFAVTRFQICTKKLRAFLMRVQFSHVTCKKMNKIGSVITAWCHPFVIQKKNQLQYNWPPKNPACACAMFSVYTKCSHIH